MRTAKIGPDLRLRLFGQAAHFSTKNPINKSAMNNGTVVRAAVFHFVHPVENVTSQDDATKLCQLQLLVNKFPDGA